MSSFRGVRLEPERRFTGLVPGPPGRPRPLSRTAKTLRFLNGCLPIALRRALPEAAACARISHDRHFPVDPCRRAAAIPPALLNVCFVLAVINISSFPAAYLVALVDLRCGRPRHSDRFRQRLGRRPAGARWLTRRRPMTGISRSRSRSRCSARISSAILPGTIRRRSCSSRPLLAHFPYAVAFIGWVAVSFLPYLAVMRAIVGRPFGLSAGAGCSDGVQQCAGRAERISYRRADRRHALSDAGTAGAGRDLSRAADLQAAIRLAVSAGADRGVALDGVLHRRVSRWRWPFASWLAFGTESWQAFFHWMPMFSQAFLTEGKAPWWKLQSLFALVRISAAPNSWLDIPLDR